MFDHEQQRWKMYRKNIKRRWETWSCWKQYRSDEWTDTKGAHIWVALAPQSISWISHIGASFILCLSIFVLKPYKSFAFTRYGVQKTGPSDREVESLGFIKTVRLLKYLIIQSTKKWKLKW